MHNTTDKAPGEVSLHLNEFACPSPIEERKWGWGGVVARGRVPQSKATLRKAVDTQGYSLYHIYTLFC